MMRYEAHYTDGYYVVIDTRTGNVVPPEVGHYKKYRDGYLWSNAAISEADALNRKQARLEELRTELRTERMSYDELVELQGLVEYIDPSDVELLEAAGAPEHSD